MINSLSGGGAEGVCVTLANKLTDRGWQVTLMVLNLNNAIRQKELKKDVELVVLGKNHARTALFAIARFLRRDKAERILVFNHQLAILLVFLRVTLFLDFKIIARSINTLSQKRTVETSFWHKHIVHEFTKIFYKKVDQIVAQSKGMAADLINFYGAPEEKLVTIHNPINRAIEDYLLPKCSEKMEFLLCVGRLELQKAFHIAIDVFAKIAPNYPALRLKIVGIGSLDEALKQQACSLGIDDKVDFEGYQSNMIPYYLKARATVLTSFYEGFPNVLVESIALGTPVVAFDCPSGPSEIVVEGVNGFLVGHLDEVHLQACLVLALERLWDTTIVSATADRFRSDIIVGEYIDTLTL